MDTDIVHALVKAVELKDLSTAAHTWRVALYTMALGEALDVDHDTLERFIRAAVLHDVGKIDIPHSILAKPGPLTDDEYAIVKTHTTLGHERLMRMGETDSIVLNLVRSHHERLDGSGYPDGLSGADIPIEARVFAVIDSFDAMTSLRPYRPAADLQEAEVALQAIEASAGIWYCPNCVKVFADLFRTGSINWVLHHFNDSDDLDAINMTRVPDSVGANRARSRLRVTPEITVSPGITSRTDAQPRSRNGRR